ncbi:MAG: hypothetical protein JJE46_03845 [Acidimicrobiia bacterium]|nr:hypothetical protein [Acidimicrobiia bacterium]
MTTRESELREDIAREERLADLPSDGVVSLGAVHRRRYQIAMLGGLVTIALVFATLVSEGVIHLSGKSVIDASHARLALAIFSVCIVVYAFDKERHLRRIVRDREQLFELDSEIARGLLSSGLVLDAVTALHANLELDDLLPAIVDHGRNLVGVENGVLFLIEDRQPMQPVVDALGIADAVAPVMELVRSQHTVLAMPVEDSLTIGVPIDDRDGSLLAVLALPGMVANELTADTRAVMARFGAAAGSALVNARRYEAAMFLLDVAH